MEVTSRHGCREVVFVLKLLPLVTAALIAASGCGERDAPAPHAAVTDTTAFQAALAAGDTTGVIDALAGFLDDYPESPFRPGAYSRLFSLKSARDPVEAGVFARNQLRTEADPASRGRLYYALYVNARDHDPDREDEVLEALASEPPLTTEVYNMIAWNLVERETRLDDAVRLARTGAAQAPDSTSRAMILDTQGWAEYKRGNLAEAVSILEEAAGLNPDAEVREHLAAAYDGSGRKAEALDLYTDLMLSQENPAMRAAIGRLAGETGRRAGDIFRRIDEGREEAAWPAPDFTLADYGGSPVSLADFRGKVVLLNFWHPT